MVGPPPTKDERLASGVRSLANSHAELVPFYEGLCELAEELETSVSFGRVFEGKLQELTVFVDGVCLLKEESDGYRLDPDEVEKFLSCYSQDPRGRLVYGLVDGLWGTYLGFQRIPPVKLVTL